MWPFTKLQKHLDQRVDREFDNVYEAFKKVVIFSVVAPRSPGPGMFWYNPDDDTLQIWNGSSWKSFSGTITNIITNVIGDRPYTNTFAGSNCYIHSTLGNNTTGDGTIGNPYQTISRAILAIGMSNPANINIVILDRDAVHNAPPIGALWNNITLLGTEFIDDTRTISSVSSTSTTNGIVFVVSGTTLADNAWEGRMLSVTGVLGNSREIAVDRNVGNTIYGVMHNRNFTDDTQSSPVGGTVNLLAYPEVNLTATTTTLASVQCNIRRCKIIGTGFTWFLNATDKIEFRYCQIENSVLNAGRAGGVYIISSICSLRGSANGIIQGRNRADVRIGYGTIFTGKNVTAGQYFIKIAEDSALVYEGGVFYKGLEKIILDGGNCFSVAQAQLKVIFDNQLGTATCAAGYIINGLAVGNGAFYNFPDTRGAVLSNYYITGQLGADITAAANTSVGTATVTNAVSATNGSTASSRSADGTIIRGGAPKASATQTYPLETAAATVNADLSVNDIILADVTSNAITINFPPSADYQDGAEITITDSEDNASANNITFTPNGADTIDQPGISVDGESYTFVKKGTRWKTV